jgi:quercetin dioxygenase-like cupin family protein
MIRRGQEMTVENRENMRGGTGVISISHLFSGEELGVGARLSARITIPPGGSIGAHEHSGEREIYYIISGTACFEENGEKTLLSPGDASITGGGGVHSIRNNGDVSLELMAVILRDQ